MKTVIVGVELKPCPFCGGGDLELVDYTDNIYGFWDYKIRCKTCRAYMDSPSTAKITRYDGYMRQERNDETKAKAKRELILAWNRRVGNKEIVGKYGCRWSDGTGNAPNGTYCGECDPSYESKCSCLVHDSGEWVECKNCIYFEECETKENRDGCYCGVRNEAQTGKTYETRSRQCYTA